MHVHKIKAFFILGVCLFGILTALPNILPDPKLASWPDFLPRDKVSLGLDLQGGSSLLLEVDVETALKDNMEAVLDEIRAIFRNEKIGYRQLRVRDLGIMIELRDPQDVERAYQALSRFNQSFKISTQSSGHITLDLLETAVKERRRGAIDQSIEIIRRRIDEMGTKEPSIQRQGENHILVQLPGVDDPKMARELIGKTAKLTFRLEHPTASMEDALKGYLPKDADLLYEEVVDNNGVVHQIPLILQKKVIITGDMLLDAQAGTHPERNTPVVNFKLDAVGARKFGEATRDNVKRRFAIILDNKIISAPVINQHIPGGAGFIEGHFTRKTATMLSSLLRAGALPAPLEVLEERTVGPDLGADSITAGEKATIIAVVGIVIFMFLAYGFFYGGVANIALALNLVFLIGALSLMGATLTLPGIAGIALTLGMAVDANVLIFERIKEELRLGHPVVAAIRAGYERAMATIVDSNVTTLIAAGLLYHFGTGPVRGFGVTLAVGILISMFTAISVTRLLAVLWLNWQGSKGMTFGIKDKK